MTETIMQFSELPSYLTIKKIVDDDTVSIVVESLIHVNKVVKMPTMFSIEFVNSYPKNFRSDVLSSVVERYGLRLEPPRYS